MLEPLTCLAANLGIQHSVFFLGVVPNPYPLILDSQFVVLPSFSEAFPTIVLECFALGKTVVGTPTKGVLELSQNGKYGIISNQFDNVAEFADLMKKGLCFNVNADELKEYAGTYDISFKINEMQNLLV